MNLKTKENDSWSFSLLFKFIYYSHSVSSAYWDSVGLSEAQLQRSHHSIEYQYLLIILYCCDIYFETISVKENWKVEQAVTQFLQKILQEIEALMDSPTVITKVELDTDPSK